MVGAWCASRRHITPESTVTGLIKAPGLLAVGAATSDSAELQMMTLVAHHRRRVSWSAVRLPLRTIHFMPTFLPTDRTGPAMSKSAEAASVRPPAHPWARVRLFA